MKSLFPCVVFPKRKSLSSVKIKFLQAKVQNRLISVFKVSFIKRLFKPAFFVPVFLFIVQTLSAQSGSALAKSNFNIEENKPVISIHSHKKINQKIVSQLNRLT